MVSSLRLVAMPLSPVQFLCSCFCRFRLVAELTSENVESINVMLRKTATILCFPCLTGTSMNVTSASTMSPSRNLAGGIMMYLLAVSSLLSSSVVQTCCCLSPLYACNISLHFALCVRSCSLRPELVVLADQCLLRWRYSPPGVLPSWT